MTPGSGAVAPTHGELLELLRRRGPTTRRDLLALTRLSRTTLVERLDTLQRLELVRAGERRTSPTGRPPVLLEFDDGSRRTLAIDLGASHAVVALTDLSARVLEARRLPADLSQRPRRVLDRLVRSGLTLLARSGCGPGELLGVGLAFPGLVGEDRHVIEAPAVLAHWDGVPAGDVLMKAFGVPAVLMNDAHAMAYGEYLADGRRRTVLVVKVATGIGAGLVLDGRLHHGDSHGAGQFGHMRVPGLHDLCSCGQRGCLATVASGRALLRRLEGRGARSVDDIVCLAEAEDAEVVTALRDAGRAVGVVLSGVVTMLDPGAILFGGPLGLLPAFVDSASAQIRTLAYPRTARRIEIGPTALADFSAVSGLAAMIVDTELDPVEVDRMVAAEAPEPRSREMAPATARAR